MVVKRDAGNEKLMAMLQNALERIGEKHAGADECENDVDYIVLLLMRLIDLRQKNQKTYVKQAMQVVLKDIHDNYMFTIKPDILAERVDYSYDRFRHIFKEQTGESVYKYLSGVRLLKAKEFLGDRVEVNVVAKRCGFKSPIRFSNWFKEQTGMSPRDYKEVMRMKGSHENIRYGIYSKNALKKPKIIFDTDLGCDPDDVAALSMLNIYKNEGLCDILCVTHCRDYAYALAAIDAINNFYGNSDIPIGELKVLGTQRKDEEKYSKIIADGFYNSGLKRGDSPEAYRLMREKLAASENVKIVCVGPLTNLARLIESGADEYSPLSGVELIEERVTEIVIMGGNFRHKTYTLGNSEWRVEYNFGCDLEAVKTVAASDTVTATFIDIELGYNVLTFENVFASLVKTPLKEAFLDMGVTKRESWDPITVLYAVEGLSGLYKYSPMGDISIDERDESVFTENENGKSRYLLEVADKEAIAAFLNARMGEKIITKKNRAR
jgi:AraC-like DNA-binding protein/inosine-uridine nucleoside N-ribohydrolase